MNAARGNRIRLAGLLVLTPFACLLGGAGGPGGGGGPEKKFANDEGWVWHINPTGGGWASSASNGLVMRLDELKDDKLLLTLAHSAKSARDKRIVRFRPVAFDANGRRFEFRPDSGGSAEDAALQGFTLDPKDLPRRDIKFIGVEKLTEGNLRDVLAPAAFKKLKDAGAQALPYPRLGQPYEFEVTTLDGKKVNSKDLRGKVVLLDFWARWCGPCMAKMPKLKETYLKHHARGLEVIGLNHDPTAEAARQVVAEQGLPWPNVLAPADGEQTALWYAATGTRSLPRLLLIDRDGVLRADVTPDQLDAEIEKLVGKP